MIERLSDIKMIRAWRCRWRYRQRVWLYVDNQLSTSARIEVKTHLAGCAECRAEYEALCFAVERIAGLRLPAEAPQATALWVNTVAAPSRGLWDASRFRWPVAAAACLFLIAGLVFWKLRRPAMESIDVTRLTGSPVVDAETITYAGRIAAGQWLETNATSRALLHVGAIGQVEVDPNSLVQFVKRDEHQYRLALARGRLYASIIAPPRTFQVETPSAVAIDLGCAYTLEVDEAGGSLLRVTSGWVALAHAGRESLVPAGAVCRTEADGRLGTPYFEDASEKFLQALARFDFREDKSGALAVVLNEARARDALTLWQLLARVEGPAREQIYERLSLLASAPAGKAETLRLEPDALARWKEAIEFAALGVDPKKVPVATGTLRPVGPMIVARHLHTATALPDGKVLIAGGGDSENSLNTAELFDPATGRFQAIQPMTSPRAGHEAVLLKNGQVLITGGIDGSSRPGATAELYDPATERFTPTGRMQIPREAHRATRLGDGRVLVTGGLSTEWPKQQLAEIYDPTKGTFTSAGMMSISRADHTATLLPNGLVLLCAGSTGPRINDDVTDTAELFDPATNRFRATGRLAVPRHKHSAVALQNGKVLVLGGADTRLRDFYNSAELYDPATGRFSATGSMSAARYKFRDAAVLLPDGKVLVAGGGPRLEIFDPAKEIFSLLPDRVTQALRYSTATRLGDGTVLLAGGYGIEGLPNAGAWLYSSAPYK